MDSLFLRNKWAEWGSNYWAHPTCVLRSEGWWLYQERNNWEILCMISSLLFSGLKGLRSSFLGVSCPFTKYGSQAYSSIVGLGGSVWLLFASLA
jgi:hypothetical protein